MNVGTSCTKTAGKLALGVAVAAAMGLSGCGNQATNGTTPAGPTATGLVSVAGTSLLRDGKSWVPHGFYQIAFEAPTNYLPMETNIFWANAQQGYTPAEYTQMAQFGADSVRLQVAQTGIDPQGIYYSAAYSNLAIGAIKAARAAGLTVIVSVQDEAQTGETNGTGMPGPATQRVWQVLAPIFAADHGVVFEMFNEPTTGTFSETVAPSAADWALWATNMNAVLATIRGAGANNVVVADGLDLAEQLTGAPVLNDTLHQVVYAAHPYSHNANDQTQASWDFKFGNFAATATAPVIISELADGYYCDNATGTSSQAFLQYIASRGIGLEMGTWDWSPLGFGTAMEGFPNNIVTTFPPAGTAICNASGALLTKLGPGKLVQTWYQTGTPSTVLE